MNSSICRYNTFADFNVMFDQYEYLNNRDKPRDTMRKLAKKINS